MNQDEFTKLVSRLPELTVPQLVEVKKRVAVLAGSSQSNKEGDDWILFGFIRYFEQRGLQVPPLTVIYRMSSYKVFEQKSSALRAIFEAAVPGMTVTERNALGIILARCLDELVRGWGMTLSIATYMNCVHKLPEAVEASFPGYMGSGLLSVLLRWKKSSAT